MKNNDKFNKLLLDSIDKGFKEIFGDVATEIIYKYLLDKYSLRREDIPERLEVFRDGVEAFFNSSAAWTVERNVLKNFYSTFGLQYPNENNKGFLDHVAKLRCVSSNV